LAVLYNFPDKAAFGKIIPKSKIYEHANPSGKVKELFVKEIEKIKWAYKLAPETLNLPERDGVREIQVFSISLKTGTFHNEVLQAQRKYTIGFILKHLHSPASVKALYQKIDPQTYVLYDLKDLQYMKIVADTLKVYYPEARITRALVQDLNKEMAKYNELRLQSMIREAKKVDLDISLPSVTGDTVTLSEVWGKGNYVLLTFWASWCRQCVSENLQLKNIYRKYYTKGLEIYAVSLDDRKENWLKQVRFDELPWINVWDPDRVAAKKYNVSMPPVNFLYGPGGRMLGRDLHGRALQIQLSQIFD
jgi:peroxiredoxin